MVEQAAALWSGENPTDSWRYADAVRHRISAYKQMLAGAIAKGELQADHSKNGSHILGNYDRSIVTRKELIRYAERKRLSPSFLFDTIAPQTETLAATDELPLKNKGGRPPEYDWDRMYAEIVRRADMDHLPATQAELAAYLETWFRNGMSKDSPHSLDQEHPTPSISSIKDRIRPLYNNLKALGWSAE
jgi:hypothetical protein